MTYWLAGLASGVVAGYLLYQNREKIGPQKDKLVKLLGELQKASEDIGKKLKAAGLEGLEKGKALAKSAGENVN
ncbi:hypothetical protein J0A68_19415 [Algoriphagus sp. H41]|uniref:YtxH domain-containing protein n=1 Tax=Algoriphagus oliviformis TaxID=2811231 RepID=A0ABS3C7Q3_9BACT|nr:hypothetical protein [Algoriphagus oliviformis]MBN7813133.1 hypothetical protein [Algoriphagus oliviformis]